MNSRFFLVAVAALAVATTAAQARTAASPPTKTPGTLVVGFSDAVVGFAAGTNRGGEIVNPRGYEVDIAKTIARQLGIPKIRWIYTPWTKLFVPGRKTFDISFQQATITAARKRTVDFSVPYMNANQGVLISKKASKPSSLADLRQMQTCAQVNTTGLDYIQTRLRPTRKPLTYQSTAAAFTAVQVGRCEALVLDVPLVALQKKSKPGAYGPVAGQMVTREQYGGVFQKGSKLKPLVDRVIRRLTANGTLGKLQKRWFNLNFAKIPRLR